MDVYSTDLETEIRKLDTENKDIQEVSKGRY